MVKRSKSSSKSGRTKCGRSCHFVCNIDGDPPCDGVAFPKDFSKQDYDDWCYRNCDYWY